MAKNSAAKIAANNRYTEKTYDRITFRCRKEDTEKIKAAATAAGLSFNAFILEAVREKIDGDKAPPQEAQEIERIPFFD